MYLSISCCDCSFLSVIQKVSEPAAAPPSVVFVWLTIFRMASYRFNMLRSPLEAVPVLSTAAARHLIPGGRGTWYLPLPNSISAYTSSPEPLIKQRERERGEKKHANTKTTSLKDQILSYSCPVFRLHASHLFRGGKLIQFATFASHLIRQPLSQL